MEIPNWVYLALGAFLAFIIILSLIQAAGSIVTQFGSPPEPVYPPTLPGSRRPPSPGQNQTYILPDLNSTDISKYGYGQLLPIPKGENKTD